MYEELLSHRVVTQARQSVWDVRRTYTFNGHKLRVTIHHDPYEFQADAYLDVFSARDLKWNRVHTLPTEEWYEFLDVLFIEKFSVQNLRDIDAVCERLVGIGCDILEGVEA
jgi:hypothetical protein